MAAQCNISIWLLILNEKDSVRQYLIKEFRNEIIGYSGVEHWPPRSPDLTPLNVFLWEISEIPGVCKTFTVFTGPLATH